MTHDFNNKNLNLTILMEECSEVIKICSKIKRFGIDNHDPETKVTNKEELLNEIGDLHAMLAIVSDDYEFSHAEIDDRAQLKFDKLIQYYSEVH